MRKNQNEKGEADIKGLSAREVCADSSAVQPKKQADKDAARCEPQKQTEEFAALRLHVVAHRVTVGEARQRPVKVKLHSVHANALARVQETRAENAAEKLSQEAQANDTEEKPKAQAAPEACEETKAAETQEIVQTPEDELVCKEQTEVAAEADAEAADLPDFTFTALPEEQKTASSAHTGLLHQWKRKFFAKKAELFTECAPQEEIPSAQKAERTEEQPAAEVADFLAEAPAKLSAEDELVISELPTFEELTEPEEFLPQQHKPAEEADTLGQADISENETKNASKGKKQGWFDKWLHQDAVPAAAKKKASEAQAAASPNAASAVPDTRNLEQPTEAEKIFDEVQDAAELSEMAEGAEDTGLSVSEEFVEPPQAAEFAETVGESEPAELAEVAESGEFVETAGESESAELAEVAESAEFAETAGESESAELAEVAESGEFAELAETAEAAEAANVVQVQNTDDAQAQENSADTALEAEKTDAQQTEDCKETDAQVQSATEQELQETSAESSESASEEVSAQDTEAELTQTANENFDTALEEIEPQEIEEFPQKRHHKVTAFKVFVVLTAVLAFSSALFVWLLFLFSDTSLFSSKPDVDLPNFQGLTQAEVERDPQYAAFSFEYVPVYSDAAGVGIILDQTPKAPKQVKENAHIVLRVSAGTHTVAVPDLIGIDRYDAKKQLHDTNLNMLVKAEDDEDHSENTVLRTDPVAGTMVDASTTVTVYVSRGEALFTNVVVPDCTGVSQTEANQLLVSRGLAIGSVQQVASERAAGAVVSQSPSAGTTMKRGSRVDLRISAGGAQITGADGHTHVYVTSHEAPTAGSYGFDMRTCTICGYYEVFNLVPPTA